MADLITGRVDRHIGEPGNGPRHLRRAVSIGVDCRNRTLYCVESKGSILAFDLGTGGYLATYSYPGEFRASIGSAITVMENSSRLVIPGLWPEDRNALSGEPHSRMFANTSLGLELSLANGGASPVANAVEQGCTADWASCLHVDARRVGTHDWAVGQGGGSRFAVVSSDGRVRTMIDVRSPEFLRDGSRAGPRVEEQMRWAETNSSIRGIYTIGGLIVVVHSRNATKRWTRGQVAQFDVFMNLYSMDGDRLVSDIRLPDLPVGHDNSHLLVMDYGPGGRRSNATDVRLLRVRVRPGTNGFTSES